MKNKIEKMTNMLISHSWKPRPVLCKESAPRRGNFPSTMERGRNFPATSLIIRRSKGLVGFVENPTIMPRIAGTKMMRKNLKEKEKPIKQTWQNLKILLL